MFSSTSRLPSSPLKPLVSVFCWTDLIFSMTLGPSTQELRGPMDSRSKNLARLDALGKNTTAPWRSRKPTSRVPGEWVYFLSLYQSSLFLLAFLRQILPTELQKHRKEASTALSTVSGPQTVSRGFGTYGTGKILTLTSKNNDFGVLTSGKTLDFRLDDVLRYPQDSLSMHIVWSEASYPKGLTQRYAWSLFLGPQAFSQAWGLCRILPRTSSCLGTRNPLKPTQNTSLGALWMSRCRCDVVEIPPKNVFVWDQTTTNPLFASEWNQLATDSKTPNHSIKPFDHIWPQKDQTDSEHLLRDTYYF